MKLYEMADAVHYKCMTTAELQERFLVEGISIPGAVELVYVDLDRTIIGFATPTHKTPDLPCPSELRAKYFCEQRERGVLIVGGAGVAIHAGADTWSYGFCWGMGDENQRYDDMDPVTIADLK